MNTCNLDPVSVRCILTEELESWKDGDTGGKFYLDIRPILHSYSFSQATKTAHSQIKREGVQSLAQCSILDCHVIFPLSTNLSRVYRKS